MKPFYGNVSDATKLTDSDKEAIRNIKPGEYLKFPTAGISVQNLRNSDQKIIAVDYKPEWVHCESREQNMASAAAEAVSKKFDLAFYDVWAALEEANPTRCYSDPYTPDDEEDQTWVDMFSSLFTVKASWKNSGPGLSFVVEN